ncbi:uncharacterized protein TRIADDRAFT_55851 [Trichoplax adhaerens]|uniref:G-protein coupled receptors family 1 profile domain-containing protein n=1 Tax=Trichoplax adhaerens TaxID=10228 RepID=B3RW15_TRIAD|nr:hypothetical protein TRIADDRAFT_55851 [Trichoplax adhaerens]EDV26096.1 hypothetical protein TRIADDRAFT_55851 [Trichoplax adhaerens]|eukprot:XP_002112129.1 hypothetical protein TRIADDRAFT_55851 [Trichoplax adhaerens]
MESFTTCTTYQSVQNDSVTDDPSRSTSIIREMPQIMYYEIVGFTALLTNGTLVHLILTHRKLWKIHNVKLCSMSTSGLFFALLFCLPYPITVIYQVNFLCYLKNPLRNFLMSCICLHLALIAVDRTITIILPFSYSKVVNRKYTYVCLTIIWLTALVGSFYPLFTFRTQGQNSTKNSCPTSGEITDELTYTLAFYSFCFLGPLLIMISCYGYIFFISLRHLKMINNHQIPSFLLVHNRKSQLIARRFKAAVPFIIITGTFIALVVPQIICSMVALILGSLPFSIRVQSLQLLINCLKASRYGLRELAFSYPALNPLIYVYFSRDIRHEIINKFGRPLAYLSRTPNTTATFRTA